MRTAEVGLTVGSIEGAGNYFLGNNRLSFGILNTDTLVSGLISDGGILPGNSGSIDKFGSGTTTFSGNNSYSGMSYVDAGTLRLGNAGALGNILSGTYIGDGATLDLGGQAVGAEDLTIQGIGIGGNGALVNSGGPASLAGSVTLFSVTTIGGSGDIALTGGVGNGALTKTGSNTLTLAGNSDNTNLGLIVNSGSVVLAKTSNTFVHAIALEGLLVTSGTLQLGGSGGDQILDAAPVTLNGGVFDFNGKSEVFDALNGSAGTITNNAGGTLSTMTIGANNGGGSFGGLIQFSVGTIAVTKTGSGTEIFSGPDTYAGATMVSQGILQGGAALTFPENSAVSVAAGALFNLGGFSQSIGSLTGAGNVTTLGTTGTDTLIIGNDFTTPAPFSGAISNAPGGRILALTKVGSGAATFSGVASYTGATAVNAGTLTINGIPFNSSATTVGGPTGAATLSFVNGASAGLGAFTGNGSFTAAIAGGVIQFSDSGTTGGHGNYTINGGTSSAPNNPTGGNGAQLVFNNGATAGNATIATNGATRRDSVSGGQTLFNAGSSAGSAMITTTGGNDPVSGGNTPGGLTLFSGNATAAGATLITNNGSFGKPGLTEFKDTSTGGTATITTNTGTTTEFLNAATAGGSTITINTGGLAEFADTSTGGKANITVKASATADFKNSASAGIAGAILTNTAGGLITFHDTTNAGASAITTNSAVGGLGIAFTHFYDSSNAATSSLTNIGSTTGGSGGMTQFHNTSNAGSAIIANNGGNAPGETDFLDSSNAGNATITNNGGIASSSGGLTVFSAGAFAGTASFMNNGAAAAGTGNTGGGQTIFNSGADADHGTFTNNGSAFASGTGFTGGHTVFNSGSTADDGMFLTNAALTSVGHSGEIDFNANSTAANGTFSNNGSSSGIFPAGFTLIQGAGGTLASAANATFTNNGSTFGGAAGGFTEFGGSSTAASAKLTANGSAVSGALGGVTEFFSDSTAAASTLITNGGSNGGGGGLTKFAGATGVNPTGGTSRVITNPGGTFDISGVPALTVGSIEGAGSYQLGGAMLTSGILDTDTTVSGVIANGGISGGAGAKITKEGTGKLILSGPNTYSGATTVTGGILSTNSLADGGSTSGIGNSSNAAANLVLNGGTFQYTGPAVGTNRLFTLGASGGALDASGTGPVNFSSTGAMAYSGSGTRTLTLTGSNSANNVLASAIGDGTGGATSVNKTGAGVWVVNAVNSYTGPTTITAGTLRYGGSDLNPTTNIQAYTLSPAKPAGNQNFSGALGLDFNVNSGKSITINQLGLFAASNNSTPFQFSSSHTVYIYQRDDVHNTGTIMASISAAAGVWNAAPISADGYRFLPLATSLTLPAGNYMVAAEAFGTDKNFNAGLVGGLNTAGQTSDGVGSISFVGTSPFNAAPGNYPTNSNGFAFEYGAGSFVYNALSISAGRLPGDVNINGSTAVLDLGGNQNGYVGTVTLDGGGSITGTGTSALTSRTSYQFNAGTVTAMLAGTGIPLVKSTAGTVTLTGTNTYTGGTSVNGGVLVIGAAGALPNAAAAVSANGLLQLSAGIGAVNIASLTITGGGEFDITKNNTLAVNYASPAADPAATIRGYLQTGRNGGLWTGAGLTSSAVAAEIANAIAHPGSGVYGIGYVDGTKDTNQAANALVKAVGNQIVYTPTIVGDTNLDGSVTFIDLGIVAQNLGAINTDWEHGDFNYDGTTNFLDIGLLAQNLSKNILNTPLDEMIPDPSAAVTAQWNLAVAEIQANTVQPTDLPEPGMISLLAVGGIGLLARRRRNR